MKLLYLLLLSLCMYIPAEAQKKFSLGLFVAPSIEKRVWLGDDWIDFKPKASFNYGLLGKYHLNEKYFIQTGISLYDKGSRYYMALISHIPNTEYYLDTLYHTRIINHIWYLSSPTTLNRLVYHTEKTVIHLSGGVTYGRRILVYDATKFNGNQYDKEYHILPYSSTKMNYWGASLGVGIIHQISPRFSLEIKPNYGRQLTRGWGTSDIIDNRGHHDSYALDLVLWWNTKKGNSLN